MMFSVPYHLCPRCHGSGTIHQGLLGHDVCPICGGDRYLPIGWDERDIVPIIEVPDRVIEARDAELQEGELLEHIHDVLHDVEEERRTIIEHAIGVRD